MLFTVMSVSHELESGKRRRNRAYTAMSKFQIIWAKQRPEEETQAVIRKWELSWCPANFFIQHHAPAMPDTIFCYLPLLSNQAGERYMRSPMVNRSSL